MRRLPVLVIIFCLFFQIEVCAKEIEEPQGLYALSAVLMDAETGRILFAKEGDTVRAMASTTKIMTCILALESGNEADIVTVSKNAANQPRVRMGIQEGEEYLLYDLLYSLMLESHNDVAVAIAEFLGGSVEGFAKLMNEKAEAIGCENTHFITPNGLDATDSEGVHSTTAADLARIMSYCVVDSPMKEMFLEITQTASYQVKELSGKRSVSCQNHNAFLSMIEEAISGKTGYTNDAGYCYVGAVESKGRTFVVALLGCGWPNNKNYKWKDMRKLVQYGMEHYEKRAVFVLPELSAIGVENGIEETIRVEAETAGEEQKQPMLLRSDETVDVYVEQEGVVTAPVQKGKKVGLITYCLNGEPLQVVPIVAGESVGAKTFFWYAQKVMEKFCVI